MKLLSYRHGSRESFGALIDRGIADLQADGCRTLREALATTTISDLSVRASAATTWISPDDVAFLPTIPVPDKLLCVGVNFRRHAHEAGMKIPEKPSLFLRTPGAQVGHGQPIVAPEASLMFDFEGELAVIIGVAGRHVPAARALDHVAGYSCFADNSVRDFQRHATQATAGKNFEHSGSHGPWMVTADEIPDPAALTLTTRLNGEQVQHSGTDDMIFSVANVIAYASTFTRLLPGDVIAMGTPEGVGMGREPKLWMKAGDVLEIEISGIGILRNTVIAEQVERAT